MTILIVKGKEFKSSLGAIDVDFRFYKEDRTPVMIKSTMATEEYHAGQISSSFAWAIRDAHEHFETELKEQFPNGYSLQFYFTDINGNEVNVF